MTLIPTNKRGSFRIRKRVAITLIDGNHVRRGHSVNLSRGGMMVAADTALVPGAQLSGTIELPGGGIPFTAEVCWVRRPRNRSLDEKGTVGLRIFGEPGRAYLGLLADARVTAAASCTLPMR
jgi:hypothetical protein